MLFKIFDLKNLFTKPTGKRKVKKKQFCWKCHREFTNTSLIKTARKEAENVGFNLFSKMLYAYDNF